jgi:hypothetical protein
MGKYPAFNPNKGFSRRFPETWTAMVSKKSPQTGGTFACPPHVLAEYQTYCDRVDQLVDDGQISEAEGHTLTLARMNQIVIEGEASSTDHR